jgi:hypothetical protein
MPEVILPTWDDVERVIRAARARLVICTPYYSARGLDRLLDAGLKAPGLAFWTRVRPSDWVQGVTDPASLATLLEMLAADGTRVDLRAASHLHAKVYAADDSEVLVGSANLSDAGFGGNVEVMVRFAGAGAPDAIASALALSSSLAPVSVEDLRAWVDRYRDDVAAAQKALEDPADMLAEAQRDIDRILGLGVTDPPAAPAPNEADLERFIEWLRLNRDLLGADMIVRRHENADGQNLQGHVRRCFAGALLFLREEPGHIGGLSAALDQSWPRDIFEPAADPGLLAAWDDFLSRRATLEEGIVKNPTLRVYLPASLGGTTDGGGAGGSTLKRLLPLVGRWVADGYG